MKGRNLLLFATSAMLIGSASAQTTTVTNKELEKYRQERLRAERELRDEYIRLGFPSPSEMARREEQANRERSDLVRELRNRRAESFAAESFVIQQERQPIVISSGVVPYYQPMLPYYYYSYGDRRHRPHVRRPYGQSGYFAGGQYWPTGNRTPSRPLIQVKRNR